MKNCEKKIEVMKSVRKRFVLFNVCPSNSDDPFRKFRNLLIAVVSLFILTSGALAATIFVSKNLENDLKNSLHAMNTMSVTIALVYMMIASYLLRHKITEVFDAMQDHYNKCNLTFFNLISEF